MLGQSQILPYFDRCGDDLIAIEEVLNAYIIWLVCSLSTTKIRCIILCLHRKLLKGSSCSRVLMKMHYLCIYLRVMYVLVPTMFTTYLTQFWSRQGEGLEYCRSATRHSHARRWG